jgi:molecular chaperone GrpE
MNRAINIPVRVVRSGDARSGPELEQDGSEPITDEPMDRTPAEEARTQEQAPPESAVEAPADAGSVPQEGGVDWQERALRLQAEMENFRRRQRRLAEDQIEAEHIRLLQAFVRVVDDLERALAAPSRDSQGLREGVLLTHRAAMNLLKAEGVERMYPEGQPFDPNWHEAIHSVNHRQANAAPDTVVQVVEPGYRMDGRLLRPSKVIVAV